MASTRSTSTAAWSASAKVIIGAGVEAAVAAVEAPVLVEPRVEGGEGGVERGHVVLERLLHPDAERGEEQGAVHALLVEQRHACVTGAVAGVLGDRVEVAEHRLHVDAARRCGRGSSPPAHPAPRSDRTWGSG